LSVSGTASFRIKETDKDGKVSYSVVKKLSVLRTSLFSFYPNSVKSELTMHWPNTDATVIHTTIMDALGRIMIDRKDAYSIKLVITLRGLAAGSYFITS
jgi:hypothetical protein